MTALDRPRPQARSESLDPEDWDEALAVARLILDDSVAYLRDVRERPVWRQMPPDVLAAFEAPLPRDPEPLSDVWREVAANVMSYPMGNIHPRFWAWYMGASNFTGALGDFVAAIQGSNLGGGAHAAALLDRQVVDWLKAMVGFPKSASGTLVSGGSMGNIIALAVARNVKAGVDVRELGVAAIPKPLRLLRLGSDPFLPPQGNGGPRPRQSGAASHRDRPVASDRPRRARSRHSGRPGGGLSSRPA